MQYIVKLVHCKVKSNCKMLKMKCLPVLLYGIDVCPVNRKQLKSLEYVLTSSLMRIFPY